MENYPDFGQICRLCLTENVGNISIFDSALSIPLRIMACTTIEVQTLDNLPQNICADCRTQLEKSYLFRKKCQYSDSKLRKHIRLVNLGKTSRIFDKTLEDDDDEEIEFADSLKFLSLIENENIEKQQKIIELEAQKLYKCFLEKERKKQERKIPKSKETQTDPHIEEKNNVLNNSCKKSKNDREINNYTAIFSTDSIHFESKTDDSIKLLAYDDSSNDANDLILLIENPTDSDEIKNGEEGTIDDYIDVAEESCSNYEEEFISSSSLERKTYPSKGKEKKLLQTEHQESNEDLQNENMPTEVDDDQLEIDDDQLEVDDDQLQVDDVELEVDDDQLEVEYDENIPFENTDSKLFKCPQCPQSFSRINLLHRHSPLHDKIKNYACKHCQKHFSTKSSLDRHFRIHSGEKPFRCDICGKCFTQREILKRHIYLHEDKKPFQCQLCDLAFIQKILLQQHLNAKHSTNPILKMYSCDLCPKSFMHSSGLSRHLLLHSGITFSCDICERKFTDKSALKRHVLSHAKQKNKELFMDCE